MMKKKLIEEEIEEEHEVIQYEDTNVRELLTLMKDNSELIADLAYAAIAFDNQELAEEVSHLESEMDKMMYQIRLRSMLGARTVEDAEQLSGLLQVASSAEKISDAAEDMSELLDMDVELKPLLPHILERADERMHTLKVSDHSDLSGRTMKELGIESISGVRIIAIRRKERWIYGPGGDSIVKKGDLLIVRGVEEGFQTLQKAAHGETEWKGVKG